MSRQILEEIKAFYLYFQTMMHVLESDVKNHPAEPLVDCAWDKSELRCIQQEDFECKHPVSEIAEITIPETFGDKNGS